MFCDVVVQVIPIYSALMLAEGLTAGQTLGLCREYCTAWISTLKAPLSF